VARWSEIETVAPELTERVRALFDAHTHHVLGTIRADGSPRLSGSEITFFEGDVWFGSMWMARKAADLRRDPRFSIHCGTVDPPVWAGDARISGTVEEFVDEAEFRRVFGEAGGQGPAHGFRADISELVVVRLGEPADHLIVDSWTAATGRRSVIRR
jgi:hypothetical protein